MVIADIIIFLMALMLIATVIAVGYSVYHSFKLSEHKSTENGVPVSLIGWCTASLVVLVALVAWLLSSLADMCIITAAVMLVIALLAVAFSKYQTIRIRQ